MESYYLGDQKKQYKLTDKTSSMISFKWKLRDSGVLF